MKDYIEVLFVKDSKESEVCLKIQRISPKGNLLDCVYIPLSKDEVNMAYSSVQNDGIPFSLGGLKVNSGIQSKG